MIRFSCPTCGKVIKTEERGAGQKIACPRCGQRVLIPAPVRTEAQIQNKTVLGKPLPEMPSSFPASPTTSTAATEKITVACPGCGRRIPLRPEELSITIECARCDTRFIPSEPSTPPSIPEQLPNEIQEPDYQPTYRPRGRGQGRSLLIALLIAALGAGAWFMFTGKIPFAVGQPATCREVAKRLQAGGMEIRWRSCSAFPPYPAIYICKGKYDVPPDELLVPLAQVNALPIAVVVQYPTPEQAREEAGVAHTAFSWGRFVIYGEDNLVQEIKKRL